MVQMNDGAINLVALSADEQRFAGLRSLSRDATFPHDLSFCNVGGVALEATDEPFVDVLVVDGPSALGKANHFIDRLKSSNPDISILMVNVDTPAYAQKINPSTVVPVASDCDGEALIGMALRAANLQRMLNSPMLKECIGSIERLPSVPKSYQDLTVVMSDPAASISDVADVIQSDPAMTIKILQLVNSVFFGRAKRTSSITQAVGFLGMELLKSLVLTAHIFDAMASARLKGFSLEHFQGYSIGIARVAQRFMTEKRLNDEAFTAAIVHDIGKLVIALQRPDAFEEIISRVSATGESQADVENEILGVSHAEAGAFLLSRWGIPWVIVEAAAFHHRPWDVSTVAGGCEVLAAVHAADALHGILTCGDPEDRLDTAFITKAGMASMLPRWRQLAEEAFT